MSILEEIKSKVIEKCGEEVISIVVYGSYARSEKYRDIDILIVLKEEKRRIERIKDIASLKRMFDFPLDINLVSKGECIDNFDSHNPLFMDIAVEGKILYDTGLMEELVRDTREYIRERKIKKSNSGWVFPVEERVETPLSSITNKEWAGFWIEDAKRDLKAAGSLISAGLFDRCVYHCQQAAEKTVKAVLICFGVYEKTHFVASLLRRESRNRDLKLKEWNAKLEEIAEICEALEPHVSLSRYPGISGGKIWLPYKEYTKEAAEKALKDTEDVIKIGEEFVRWWFER